MEVTMVKIGWNRNGGGRENKYFKKGDKLVQGWLP